MWRVGQSYKSLILRQCYCSVQCQCVCLVTDVSIVVFLFIQITASKLMSDFRLSKTFTVSIVSGKWVFSIRSFRFVYHARDEGTQNPWRISKENTTTKRSFALYPPGAFRISNEPPWPGGLLSLVLRPRETGNFWPFLEDIVFHFKPRQIHGAW